MNNKVPKRLLVAAVLTTVAFSTSAFNITAFADDWQQGMHITGNMTIDSGSNFSHYVGAQQGVLVNWGTDTVTVSGTADAVFKSNTAVGDAGGALFNANGATTIIDTASQFIENTANRAGAVWNNGTLTFNYKATFTGNNMTGTVLDAAANVAGGAIFNSSYNLDSRAGTLTFNKGVEFSGNSALQGGAIRDGGKTTVSGGAKFENNKATAGDGGSILLASDAGIESATPTGTYDNLTVTGSTAAGNGGGAAINKGASLEVTENAIFQSNSAGNNGGGISNAGSVTLTNAQFGSSVIKNEVGIVTGIESQQMGNSSVNHGGAISNIGASARLQIGENSIFAGNSTTGASGQGGALANMEGAVSNIGNGTIFAYNHSATAGGAISSTVNDAQITTTNTIIGNDVQFVGNSSGAQGGAIHNQRTSMTIGDKAKFYNNSSGSYAGGAIYQETSENMPKATLTIGHNAEFVNNESKTSFGGAIFDFNAGGGTELTVGSQALFKGNKAASNGGAIASYGGVFKVDAGATFTGNKSGGLGGAVFNDSYGQESTSKLTINGNTTFENNSAQKGGGAIYNAGLAELNTTAGDIKFTGNTAAGNANDIYAADNSVTELTGSNTVSINSGIAGTTGAQFNNKGTTLDLNASAGEYKGAFKQESGTTNVSKEFFGGKTEIEGGSVLMEDGSSVVSGSDITVSAGSDMEIDTDANVTVSGAINAAADTFVNNGNLTITGKNASLTGNLTQNYSGATLTVSNGASLDIDQLAAGTLKIDRGVLADDLEVTNAVDLEISGITTIDGTGLKVGENYIINASGSSLNLSGDFTVDGGVLGTSVIISNGSINSINPEGNITIESPDKLTLSDNATSNHGYNVTTGTLQLAPTEEGTLNLGADNAITGNGSVVVEQIVVQNQVKNPDYKPNDSNSQEFITKTICKGVGTINIASDNSKFTGTYTQNDGTVVVQNGGVFFGGTNGKNTINTVKDSYTGTYHGGELVLEDGALLASDVTLNGNANADVMDLASVMFKDEVIGTGEDGALTQADIATTGVFKHAAINDGTANVNVKQAGAVFANGQTFDEDISLVSNSGVRLIGFADGSGVNGNITLGGSTGLLYMDGALIKDDSSLNMTDADLIFANNENISYNPEIKGSGTISMYGSGTTSVASALNEKINVVSENGVLNLDNKATTAVGNIKAYDGAINLKADNVTVKDVKVSGSTGSASFSGNVTSTGNATVTDGASLSLIGQTQFANMTLNNATLNTMGNNAINTVTVGNLDLSANSNILFDVDPRTNAMDSINATTIINDSDSTVLVSGINFTQSPIDRNVTFDITNLIQENGQGQSNLVRLPDGGVVANSAMGQYLITSQGGASPILDASLLSLNPQMYRGQVATIASWQNQLLVNNLLFDHMNLVTRKLMDEERTANKYAAAVPQIDPYQYSIQDGSLWYKAYGAFETLSMTKGLNVGNNAYGSLIGADFPLINLKNGWKLVPTAYIGYNGAHQHFNGVSMYQNGAQLGIMGTAYKGDFMTSLLAYGGGYANDMTVRGQYGGGSDTTGNWFAGVASKSAYNIRLPHDFIIQPAFMAAYNAFGQQNWGSDFGNMSMSAGMLNGLNIAPGLNFIWQKETFSIYAVTQLVYNVMGGVDGKAGNIDLGYVRMRHCYFEYGLGVMKKFKDRFSGYLQFTIRNGGRTGIGFSGGLQWKIGK